MESTESDQCLILGSFVGSTDQSIPSLGTCIGLEPLEPLTWNLLITRWCMADAKKKYNAHNPTGYIKKNTRYHFDGAAKRLVGCFIRTMFWIFGRMRIAFNGPEKEKTALGFGTRLTCR